MTTQVIPNNGTRSRMASVARAEPCQNESAHSTMPQETGVLT